MLRSTGRGRRSRRRGGGFFFAASQLFDEDFAQGELVEGGGAAVAGAIAVAEALVFLVVSLFGALFLRQVGDGDELPFNQDRGVVVEGFGEGVDLEADFVVFGQDLTFAAGQGEAEVEGAVEPAEGQGDGVGAAGAVGHAESADAGFGEEEVDFFGGHFKHGIFPWSGFRLICRSCRRRGGKGVCWWPDH